MGCNELATANCRGRKNGGCGSIETGGCPPNTALVVLQLIVTLLQLKEVKPVKPEKTKLVKGT